jgi:hypothetical protein
METDMSTAIRSALVALILLTGASAAMAGPRDREFTDLSKPDGGYAANSPAGERAYWDYVDRWRGD